MINVNFNKYVIKEYDKEFKERKFFNLFIDKFTALNDLFQFLNDVLNPNTFKVKSKLFINDEITINAELLNNINNENISKLFNLLFHLQKCHHLINNKKRNDETLENFMENLIQETINVFKTFDNNIEQRIGQNKKLIKEFLFLVAHRDGLSHKNQDYAKRIGTYREKLLKLLENKVINNLDDWINTCQNKNNPDYEKAKVHILECIRELNWRLDLSNLNLSDLPICISYLGHIKELNISSNKKLKMYDKNETHEYNEDKVKFNALFCINSNDSIELKAFKYLFNLTTLNLSNNNINEIKIGTFDKFTGLENLNLSNNSINMINSMTFDLSKLKELKILNLSGNQKKLKNNEVDKPYFITKSIFNNTNNHVINDGYLNVNHNENNLIIHPIILSFTINKKLET